MNLILQTLKQTLNLSFFLNEYEMTAAGLISYLPFFFPRQLQLYRARAQMGFVYLKFSAEPHLLRYKSLSQLAPCAGSARWVLCPREWPLISGVVCYGSIKICSSGPSIHNIMTRCYIVCATYAKLCMHIRDLAGLIKC